MAFIKTLKLMAVVGCLALATQLSGCATATSGLECAAESMNPTVMAAIDSFESAAIAIRLSNRVLLEMPINEQDSWPGLLYGAPSGAALFKMGLSLFASSQGITVALEIDPQTGLPRPTSALYLFLKEREQMLAKEASKEDIRFFKSQPPRVIAREIPFHLRKPKVQLIDEHVYRNPLMAFGVVTANRQEMVRVQQDIDLLAQGFRQCDAWVHKSKAGDVKPAACQDPALKQDALEARIKKASYTPPNSSPAATPAPAEPAVEETPTPAPSPVAPPRDLGASVSNNKANAAKNANNNRKTKNAKSSKNKRGKTVEPQPEVLEANTAKNNAVEAAPKTVPPPPPLNGKGVVYVNERDRQTAEKAEELETMRKNYGKLAGRVYNAAVAGADFTMASTVKIGCAIVNGVRALPNINNEFRGARGVYNIAMVISRVKMVMNSFGFYKDNLGLQYTAYKSMYQQIKGTYPDLKDDDPETEKKTLEAMRRIELASAVLSDLEPKLALIAKGKDVEFTDAEVAKLNNVAKLYPDQKALETELLAAWRADLQH